MMRHFRPSGAVQPRCAARSIVTGFNLFAHELQKENGVLVAQTLKEGQSNMRVISAMWRQLSAQRRATYNGRAMQCATLTTSDPEKKNNTFNLIMRLFGSNRLLLSAGDQRFTAQIAKATMHAMTQKHVRQLHAKLKVTPYVSSRKHSNALATARFRRFTCPNMVLFNSFTEMQRSVAPTRESAFAAITKTLSVSNVTTSGEQFVLHRYRLLSPEVRNRFAPITDVEAPFFEVFCATRCSGMMWESFEIMRLFALFRGIQVDLPCSATCVPLYRTLLDTDRSADGIYFRARRCLQKIDTMRSSDCGLFLAKQLSDTATIKPATYGIDKTFDDVSVATLLAETREGQSVYDDILTRAAILRRAEMNRKLAVYDVAQVAAEQTSVHQSRLQNAMSRVKVAPALAAAAMVPVKAKVVPVKAKARLVSKRVVASAPRAIKKAATPKPVRARATRVAHRKSAAAKRTPERRAPTAARMAADAHSAEEDRDTIFGEDYVEESQPDDVDSTAEDLVAATTAPVRATPAKRAKKTAGPRAGRSQLLTPESMLPDTARAGRLIATHTPTRRKAPQPATPASPATPFVPARRKISFVDNIRAQLASFL
ncbi:hypothetical protein NESM_000583000 [Novymonas esmeraldas]|uniref:Uncharacterized protein n=1 Tax=Novymonas esmeraldas TaxID=1808958 RepID=A0AAW0ES35_9TRYP